MRVVSREEVGFGFSRVVIGIVLDWFCFFVRGRLNTSVDSLGISLWSSKDIIDRIKVGKWGVSGIIDFWLMLWIESCG